MNDFIYQNATKVYFGRDQLKNLSNELKLYGNKVLLPIGGGSTIDATKAIAAGYYYDGDVWDLWTRKVRFNKALPIIDILTLSATGSETNMGGVISKMDTNEKLVYLILLFYQRQLS